MDLTQFTSSVSPLIKNGTTMKKRDLVFMDLETTGLEANHEIIEIGWLKVNQNDLTIIEEMNIKIKPTHIENADPKALEINKYNSNDWKDAISLLSALEIFTEKCQGCVLTGYNFFYDWAWLYKAFFDNGATIPPFYYHKLDVLSMAFVLLNNIPNIENFSLNDMCNYFNIKRENAHSALFDAKFTFEVYKKLIEKSKN